MKVLGQLESAQIENLVGDPANHPTGRVYADITTPTAALPKFYDGTKWQTLGYASPASGVFSQNSGGNIVTVDWAKSLAQEIVLTGHCVVQFTNPVEGQIHTLHVKQAAFSPPVPSFTYVFDMADQDVTRARTPYQPEPLPGRGSRIHQWLYHIASVNAYTTVPANWQGSPSFVASPTSIDMTRDGKWVVWSHTTSPFSFSCSLTDRFTDLLSQPIGATYVTATASAAAPLDGMYSPDANVYSLVSGTTPFLQTWFTLNGGNTGGVVSNPGTLPAGAAKCVAWHPLSNAVAVGTGTTPFLQVWPFQNQVYGTILSNPSTLPTGQVNGIAWHPHGNYIAIAIAASPFVSVYAYSTNSVTGIGSFGAKVNDPLVLPGSGPLGSNHHQIAWRPQGDWLAMCMNNATSASNIYLIPFDRVNAVFGTPVVVPVFSGAGNATAVMWTPDGQFLVIGTNAAPSCYVYDFSTPGTLVAVTLDNAVPTNNAGMVMHPSGLWGIFLGSSSPHLQTFIPPNKQRNYVRIV